MVKLSIVVAKICRYFNQLFKIYQALKVEHSTSLLHHLIANF